jgi:ADP-L-glycero-D-manno-heptose 6-epimerase
MKKDLIIITGGAGFIGSNLLYGLNIRGYTNIIIVDSLKKTEKWKNLRGLDFVEYYEKNRFKEMIRSGKLSSWGIKTIFHLGACSDTTEKDADYLMENNFGYTKLLAEEAVKNNIQFIYASSAATYGDGSKGFSDKEDSLESFIPLNIYGYSKHVFDVYAKKTGLLSKITGLKFFNVFGPNEYHKGNMRSFIIKAYEQIIKTGKVKLFKSYNSEYKDGEQVRDFIYVRDAVNMILFFFNNKILTGIFNIGSGTTISWNTLVKEVFQSVDKKPVIKYIEMPVNIKNQYQYYTKADISKIRKLGYDEEISDFKTAVKDYVLNYLSKNKYVAEIKNIEI